MTPIRRLWSSLRQSVFRVLAERLGNLLIEVHDDGPGIPRKYQLLVWEKFERGPNRLNATVPGSGIGMKLNANEPEALDAEGEVVGPFPRGGGNLG